MRDSLDYLTPEDVLRNPLALKEYEREIGVFYQELIRAHNSLHILQQVAAFPFGLLGYGANPFFTLVVLNFRDIIILSLHKLVNEKSADFHSLMQFKNHLYKNLIKEEHKVAFAQRLEKQRFDARAKQGLEKVGFLRNTRIAHLKRDVDVVDFSEGIRLDMVELDDLFKIVVELFHALTFDTEYRTLFLDYDQSIPRLPDWRPDIERILDNIARESTILNEPERYPDRWEYHKKRWSAHTLAVINKYRRKLDLPPA